MGRVCLVCSSIHQEEYERMKFEEGKSIKEVWIYSDSKYKEGISYHSFQRHFKHAKKFVEESKKVHRLRQKIIEESIQKDVEIARRIERNLEICDTIINDKSSILKDGRELSTEDIKILFNGLTETRYIIDQLLKWQKQLNLEPKESEIEDRIMFAIQDFSIEDKRKFLERWETYDKSE